MTDAPDSGYDRRHSFKVVLNRNQAYSATTGEVFTLDGALELARHYYQFAKPGQKVQIFYPYDSRDMADWQWLKGYGDPPPINVADLRRA